MLVSFDVFPRKYADISSRTEPVGLQQQTVSSEEPGVTGR